MLVEVTADDQTLNSMTRDEKTYFYLTDALGSVVAVTNEAGVRSADPEGEGMEG